MKITKAKLKQIIKEELSVVLNEQQGDLGFPEEEAPPAEWRVGPDLSPEEKQEQIVFEKEHYPALSDKVQGLRDRYGAEARIIEDPKGPVIAVWWLEEDDQEEDAEIFDSVEEAIEMLEKGANHWVGRSTRRYLGSEK
tara:strand:+ start:1377 stop:1790 length:414 start_codon:yes stop_codon:yes gene_type:complete